MRKIDVATAADELSLSTLPELTPLTDEQSLRIVGGDRPRFEDYPDEASWRAALVDQIMEEGRLQM